MELDRISIKLRQRGGFESIDLGVRMAVQSWRPLWSVWLLCFLPLSAAAWYVFRQDAFLAFLAIWWMKPVPERFALHVLSRAVFGELVSVRAAFAAWREVLSPGLFAALTWRRPFDWMRSFNTPVNQLERQQGREAGERRRTLGMRFGSYAFALSFLGLVFEFVIGVGLAMLVFLFLTPEGNEAASSEEIWEQSDTLFFSIAMSVIGPFYVASGFSLYLNRRIILEAWDVELNLKRLRARVDQLLGHVAPMLITGLVCVGLLAGAGRTSATEPSGTMQRAQAATTASPTTPMPLKTKMRETTVEVLKDPEFGSERQDKQWRWRFEGKKQKRKATDWSFLSGLGEVIASVLQIIGWIVLAAILGVLVWYLIRTFAGHDFETRAPKSGPQMLFGLQIAPESLPDDITLAALALIERGQLREALSLIYRGALSHLVHARNLKVSAGATENEVAKLSRRVMPAPGADYFGQVLANWIDIAYAGRLPDPRAITDLAQQYRQHFAKPAGDSA